MTSVGVTGGIGCGKSVVCNIFHRLGIPVYQADEAGRRILTGDEQVKSGIRRELGDAVFDPNGDLSRTRVAELVFKDKALLDALNAIVHPAVAKDFGRWVQQHKQAPYIVKEAAILFESGTYKDLDVLVTVTAPLELRINRVMKRDGVSRENVEHRMRNQWSDEEKIKRSHFVIYNDEEQLLIPQVLSVHGALLKKKK